MTTDFKEPNSFFKTIKIPLQYILKNPDINLPIISNAVIKSNKIVIHTLLFMKLFLLKFFKDYNHLPFINEQFVTNCLKIQCIKTNNSGSKPSNDTQLLKDQLILFYNEHYKPLIHFDNLDYLHLNTVFKYLAIDIITKYENNIKLHYFDYINKYINFVTHKKDNLIKIKNTYSNLDIRKQKIREFFSYINNLKSDILNVSDNDFKSEKKYHKWIKKTKLWIIPIKDSYKKDNLHYDIQCKTQDYLPCMIRMMNVLEKSNETIFNIFPMRNSLIPSHICLDTDTLVHLLFTKKQGLKVDYIRHGNLKKFEDKIWKFFFRTERKCFKNTKFSFHHMIHTDGISCSILLKHINFINKRVPNIVNDKELYIDKLDNYSDLKDKKLIAFDPNKGNLIYCVDNDNINANKFRYTQDSRRKEAKLKKYANIILKLKKFKINGKTIIEYETELSKFNKKTLNIGHFKNYIIKKTKLNSLIMKFYENYIFRKLKLNRFINIRRHEQLMINKFKELYGEPNDVIIAAGNWTQQKQMKYKESSKGIGMRNLFRTNGYKVYLVDEFRTSCRCSKCGGENEKFLYRDDPRPNKNKQVLVHGVIRCKICKTVWNRDVNSATNIYRIAKKAITEQERPEYLKRNI